MHPVRRRTRWVGVIVVVAVIATAAVIGIMTLLSNVVPQPPSCTLGSGSTSIDYDPEQAADAATIAAVAKRRGLANHAVTVALATALQESKLFNVEYGDRDSVGLFQQRPSQGWGSPQQLIDPAYAANAFYSHLEKVPSWRTLPVADAAQRVQHSADGSAYAQWEEQARALARALTGEVPAGLTCQWSDTREPHGAALTTAATRELGANWRSAGSAGTDWTVAEWLVAHSYEYGVASVTVRGKRWTAKDGKWRPYPAAPGAPSYRLSKPSSR
jgi:hypothetical protein